MTYNIIIIVMVERNLAFEQLEQELSRRNEKIDELKGRLEQIEREKSQLNTENEDLAKRK